MSEATDDIAVQGLCEENSEAELGWLSFKSKGGGMALPVHPFACTFYKVVGDEGIAYNSKDIYAPDAQTAADLWAEELMGLGEGGGYVVARIGEEEAFTSVMNASDKRVDMLVRTLGAGLRHRLTDEELLAIATNEHVPALVRSDVVATLKRRSSERPVLRDALEVLGLATFEEGR